MDVKTSKKGHRANSKLWAEGKVQPWNGQSLIYSGGLLCPALPWGCSALLPPGSSAHHHLLLSVHAQLPSGPGQAHNSASKGTHVGTSVFISIYQCPSNDELLDFTASHDSHEMTFPFLWLPVSLPLAVPALR